MTEMWQFPDKLAETEPGDEKGEFVKRGEVPSWMQQTGWVSYKGEPGHSEPGQALLHGHLPEEWGGSGPDHEDCKPLYEVIDDPE